MDVLQERLHPPAAPSSSALPVRPTARPARPPPLEERLAFLRRPLTHAGHAHAVGEEVSLLETHMSWVFLAGDKALKMKKALLTDYLDFSNVQAREVHCREELRLNARLAPGVYEGLMALQWDGQCLALHRERALDPRAQVLDWLVLMRRLPAQRMLDTALVAGRVGPEEVDALGRLLAAFYRGAAAAPLAPGELTMRLRQELARHRAVLLPRGGAPATVPGAAEALRRYGEALDHHAGRLEARVRARRVVDGHGDLRPEHVCLTRPPVIIDALEFSAALRQVDPLDELAFLGLECEALGAPWVGPRLVQACTEALGDETDPVLLALYGASRGLLRARLALAHLLDFEPRTPERWPRLATRYVALATDRLDDLETLETLGRTPHPQAAPTPPAQAGQAGAVNALRSPPGGCAGWPAPAAARP